MLYEEDFENQNSINGATANEIISDLTNQIRLEFGEDVEIAPFGSCRNLRTSSHCEEVEILVGIENSKNEYGVNTTLDSIIQLVRKVGGEDITPVSNNFGAKVSFNLPLEKYGESGMIPVTLKLSNNFEWSNGMSRGKRFTDFDDLVRTLLIKEAAAFAPYQGENPEQYETEYYTSSDFDGTFDGEIKKRWRYMMGDEDGLTFASQNRKGKRSPAFRSRYYDGNQYPRWEDTAGEKMPVTSKFSEALKIIFGPEVRYQDVLSAENIVKFLFSGRYAYAEKDRLENIRQGVINALDRNKRGDEEEGRAIIEQFNELWNQYAGDGASSLMECTNMVLSLKNIMNRMNIL